MDPIKTDHDVVLRTAIVGLFVLSCMYSLYFAAEFFLPLTVAVLFHLVLRPVIRFLNGLGLSPTVAALAVVFAIIGALTLAVAYLLAPIDQWVRDLPRISWNLQQKVQILKEPIDLLVEARKEVEEITKDDDIQRQQVIIQEDSPFSDMLSTMKIIGFQIFSTLFLLFFLLAYSGEFMDRTIELLKTGKDKRELREFTRSIEKTLSKYLATITLINMALGFTISACMLAIGMPTFYLWGVMAAILNFIPYLGSVIGMIVVAVVALVTFDSALYALLAPSLYLMCSTLEGNFVTPAVLGRSLSLNPIVIFVSVVFWAWIWGPLGALMAVPILIVMKVIADQVEMLKPMGHIIGRDPLVRPLTSKS